MRFLLGMVKWVLGLWLKQPPAPSQEAVQAKEAGAAESALTVETKADAEYQAAAIAGQHAAAAIDTDAGLRAYEQQDPNNRDNRP